MIKTEIKKGVSVIDRWYPDYGTGFIIDVNKTRFTIDFGGKAGKIKYDYPHAQFLDKV